jgi:hypothetical protein
MVVDGQFKDEAVAKKAAEELLTTYPLLRVEIYDASAKVRTLVNYMGDGRPQASTPVAEPRSGRRVQRRAVEHGAAMGPGRLALLGVSRLGIRKDKTLPHRVAHLIISGAVSRHAAINAR